MGGDGRIQNSVDTRCPSCGTRFTGTGDHCVACLADLGSDGGDVVTAEIDFGAQETSHEAGEASPEPVSATDSRTGSDVPGSPPLLLVALVRSKVLEWGLELSLLLFLGSQVVLDPLGTLYATGHLIAVLLPLLVYYYAKRHGEHLRELGFRSLRIETVDDGISVRTRIDSDAKLRAMAVDSLVFAGCYTVTGSLRYLLAVTDRGLPL